MKTKYYLIIMAVIAALLIGVACFAVYTIKHRTVTVPAAATPMMTPAPDIPLQALQQPKIQPPKTLEQTSKAFQQSPATPAAKQPCYWFIQVGSFAQSQHATDFVKELRYYGFEPVYIQTVQQSEGQFHRVVIGPFKQQVRVERLHKWLKEVLGLPTLVTWRTQRGTKLCS